MSKEINNFQIENAIAIIGDDDLISNFVGVFPLNHMNKLFNHAAIFGQKRENIL